MDINLWAVLAATAVMFAVGAFWYMVPFADIWGKIHGFDKLSQKQQKEMQSKMGPWYAAQLIGTVLMAYVLAHFMSAMPDVPFWKLAFLYGLGLCCQRQPAT